MVRCVCRLRGSDTYCIVSIYPAPNNGVHVAAYDQEICQEYQLILIPSKLLKLGFTGPPDKCVRVVCVLIQPAPHVSALIHVTMREEDRVL